MCKFTPIFLHIQELWQRPQALRASKLRQTYEKSSSLPSICLWERSHLYIDRIADMILKNALTEEEKDFNLTTYYGADATMADVVLACRRYPMMA